MTMTISHHIEQFALRWYSPCSIEVDFTYLVSTYPRNVLQMQSKGKVTSSASELSDLWHRSCRCSPPRPAMLEQNSSGESPPIWANITSIIKFFYFSKSFVIFVNRLSSCGILIHFQYFILASYHFSIWVLQVSFKKKTGKIRKRQLTDKRGAVPNFSYFSSEKLLLVGDEAVFLSRLQHLIVPGTTNQ